MPHTSNREIGMIRVVNNSNGIPAGGYGMWNVVGEMASYLKPGPGHSKHSSVGTNAYEIVSGYMSPRDKTDKSSKHEDSIRNRVGILYADIAEAARPEERVESDFQARLDEAVSILMVNIAGNDGRLVKMDGHAILAEFKDTDRALHCAINVQLASRQWNASLPFERRLLFRIGVTHADADADADQENPGNRSKCLAAYLEKLASIGGICISESVRTQFDGHPSLKLVAGGKQHVKNLCVPVESFWIEIDTDHFVTRGLTGAVKVRAAVS